jgi:cell division protein YceG involved in septum cleavage
MCLVFFFFFLVGTISDTSVEMQTRYTIKHDPSLQYNNVINVSVHQNSHHIPLLKMFKKQKYVRNVQIFRWWDVGVTCFTARLQG